MVLAIVVTSLFGFADELRQSFNPLRYMEFMDWVGDTSGGIVAVLAYTLWPFYRNLLEWPLNPLKRFSKKGAWRFLSWNKQAGTSGFR